MLTVPCLAGDIDVGNWAMIEKFISSVSAGLNRRENVIGVGIADCAAEFGEFAAGVGSQLTECVLFGCHILFNFINY